MLGAGRWRSLCNRHEALRPGPNGGRECLWEHSSDLTVARLFPRVGARLLHHCLPEVPLHWGGVPSDGRSSPAISVLVPAGGRDRRPLLAVVLAALTAEALRTAGGAEIVLAEQLAPGAEPAPAPAGVRRVSVEDAGAFNKSRLLNRAAAVARGDVLVIHDADFLAPPGYLGRCARRMEKSESARPGRLIFYADRHATARWTAGRQERLGTAGAGVEKVVQNAPNPLVVRRSAYYAVGGHDEAFAGWGGEDLEFLSRLRTRTFDDFGAEPVIHLWHPAAPKKASGDRNGALQARRLAEPPAGRIARLREQAGGGRAWAA